ncbi:hypothetical protein P3X46_019076 [Hevea brasiliensis]|uniref:Uncharacterized protein n=1 Tax=Hevea brasiliensis TaxID=3981 RepID=A0ABQ9LWK4_HEVBR|nr:hypothetical protein P3X46_019076 [Hevea brasiliensis]
MVNFHSVKVVDEFQISPPPSSVPTTSLPLTFFDIPWFLCRPMQRLFFFEFPHPTSFLVDNVLPNLKHSLSLTLQHFFPFAANITYPSPPQKPCILFQYGDSIPFIVAESTADFNLVISNHPMDVRELHPYVPKLPPQHLLAVQVTLFPNSGIGIGFEFCHVVADGMAFNHFVKSWASVYRSGGDLTCLDNSLPSHAREAIRDPQELEPIFLRELQNWTSSWDYDMGFSMDQQLADKVKATFVSLKCLEAKAGQIRISKFVVICAFVWVNVIKSREDEATNYKVHYLGFVADCRGRLKPKLPITYFGNCLSVCYASAKRSELIQENGITIAAKAIAKQVKELENGVLERAEKWMSDWKEISEQGTLITISGSPKLRVCDIDFGWGRPKKSKVVQIDVLGAVSISKLRDGGGGVEVGLALPRSQMDVFNALFQQHLERRM